MRKKAYFISDIHLGATYMEDVHECERRVITFLDSIADSAEEIYLLGDILDYWFEYKYVVPKGFVRFFGKIAELSDRGIKITWLIGNHDIWIFDYLPGELGIRVIDGVLTEKVLGKTVMVMAHGDGVWKRSRSFTFIRSIFRNKFCQKLYSGIHPRWTVPFAHKWSNHSRFEGEDALRARERRREEMKKKQLGLPENIRQLARFCNENFKSAPKSEKPQYYIFGHLHEVVDEKLECGAEMLVIGDWLVKFTYAEYDGENMYLKKYSWR